MAKKLKTNEDLVKDLMNFSPYGALSQMFIMEAIRRYCDEVEEYEITEEDKRSIIDMNAWKGVAKDIKKRTEEFRNKDR